MRPIWTGAITFGLVNIPIKLYSAIDSKELDLDMLDKKDHANIRFKRVNEKTGKEVPWENIVKGFKIEERYVVLDDEDFENASAKKSKLIEISEFVNEGEIESIYYETPYYLVPEDTGSKDYALLNEALTKTGRVGIATFVMRNKENIAALKPMGDVIILHRLRFQEEIKDLDNLELPDKNDIRPSELKMAVSLIDQLTTKFDISQYKDTYTSELLKVIQAKAKGIKPKPQKLEIVHTRAEDLMQQLKASLELKRQKVS